MPASLAQCAALYLLTEMKRQSQIEDKAKLILLFHQPECLLGTVCPKPHMGDFFIIDNDTQICFQSNPKWHTTKNKTEIHSYNYPLLLYQAFHDIIA